jgi:hypothetical protein
LPLSFPPPGVAIANHIAIGLDGKPARAGQPIIGFSDYATDGTESFLVITGLTAMAMTGAPIAETVNTFMVDATSRLVPWATGNSIAATRMPCASVSQVAVGAGELIEVIVYRDRPTA